MLQWCVGPKNTFVRNKEEHPESGEWTLQQRQCCQSQSTCRKMCYQQRGLHWTTQTSPVSLVGWPKSYFRHLSRTTQFRKCCWDLPPYLPVRAGCLIYFINVSQIRLNNLRKYLLESIPLKYTSQLEILCISHGDWHIPSLSVTRTSDSILLL